MADITDDIKASGTSRIVGSDEQFAADVKQDVNQENRLLVDSRSTPATLRPFFENVKNGSSPDMTINTSGTDFTLNSDVNDIEVTELRFYGRDNGIGMADFLGGNSELTNGILVEIKTEDVIVQFPLIKSTDDFRNKFSGSDGFFILFPSGSDTFTATFKPSAPFLLKSQGTYASDDYIKVVIQDNLSGIDYLEMLVVGGKV